MPPIFRQSRATFLAAAMATVFAPTLCLGQGDFVPNEQVSRTIDLKPIKKTLEIDPLAPPTPNSATTDSTNRRSVAPANVDYEVISSTGERVYKDAGPVISGAAEFAKAAAIEAPVKPNSEKTNDVSDEVVYEVSDHRNRTAITPIVTIEIDSAHQVNVQEKTDVAIRLRNAGSEKVQSIEFAVQLPKHAKFISAKPTPVSDAGGKLVFDLANLGANQERSIAIQVIPTEKKPLEFKTRLNVVESQTTVVSVREPKLKLTVKGPNQVNIGAETTHIVKIQNVGDGLARKVRLQGNFPDELRFLKQQGMSAPKDLNPGESLTVVIESLATLPGQVKLDFTAEGERVAAKPAGSPLKISQPELKVLAVGPNMNFIDRDGIYSIKVDNSGEVDVSDVAVTLAIPKGMKVTTINRKAKMDEASQTLTWKFDKISAQSDETIQLKAVSNRVGEQICRIMVASNETKRSEFTLKTAIASRADLSISMANNSGPVQVGSKATFDVTVINKGSQAADDVEVTIDLPASLMAVRQDNVIVDEATNSVTFLNSQIKPGKKLSFAFQAVGVAKGEHIVRSALKAGGSERRVIVEDSVYVYETNESRISENLTPVFPR